MLFHYTQSYAKNLQQGTGLDVNGCENKLLKPHQRFNLDRQSIYFIRSAISRITHLDDSIDLLTIFLV